MTDHGTQPFEDPAADYRVLVNDEGQHSLWPAFAPVPDGWDSVHGPDSRERCLDHITANWTDLRPASLIRATASHRPGATG
ncbi:MbtH family protein [Streptomyces monticola]|uniref:MbtH family protein n=1 Tax=Streptomyces monticola TaxID=2666263 RepID=A0ABW2JYS7_9ACTN